MVLSRLRICLSSEGEEMKKIERLDGPSDYLFGQMHVDKINEIIDVLNKLAEGK